MTTMKNLANVGHVIFTCWHSGIDGIQDGKHNVEPTPSYFSRKGFQPVVRRNVKSDVAENAVFVDYSFLHCYSDLVGERQGVQAVTFRKLPVRTGAVLEKSIKDEPAAVLQYDARTYYGFDGRFGSSTTYSIFLGESDYDNILPEVTRTPKIIPEYGRELFPSWFPSYNLREPILLVRTLEDAKEGLKKLDGQGK